MKLICIGDSLTFGYGVRPSQRWTRLCEQESGWKIVNEGISGDTTGGMLVRLRALLTEGHAVCAQRPWVFLMGGANDIFFSGTDTCARANMGAMLNQLLSMGIQMMVGIPTPISAKNAPPAWATVVDFNSAERHLMKYCEWLQRFSECFGIPYIDFRTDFLMLDGVVREELLLDGLHPTPEGHQLMAARLSEQLAKQ